jgi:hypothetical protein
LYFTEEYQAPWGGSARSREDLSDELALSREILKAVTVDTREMVRL